MESSSGGKADQVAVHEAGESLPAAHLLGGLKAERQLEATLPALPAVEADQLHLVEHLHVSFVQLPLQKALDTLWGERHGRGNENQTGTVLKSKHINVTGPKSVFRIRIRVKCGSQIKEHG